MADNSASFAIGLEDETSGAADAAAGALEKLKAKIDEDTGALRAMQAAMRQLQGGSAVNIEAFKQLRDRIDAQKASIASAQEQYIKLGGSFKALKPPAEEAGKSTAELGNKAQKLALKSLAKDALGLSGGYARLGGSALAAGGAIAVMAVAVVGLTIALVAVVAKLAEFALGAADAARTQGLMLEAASAAGGHAVESYDALADAVGRVANSVPIAQSEVAGFAEELLKAKFHGAELEKALQAVSIAKSAGQDTAKLVEQLKAARAAGVGVDAIAKKIDSQFGGVVRARMLSLDVQTMKFKEHVSGLFANVKIEPFLEALSRVLSIFDKDTIAGHALQVLAETLLNPLFGMLTKLEPLATNFFKGIIIGALLFTVAVLKIRNAFRDAFGGDVLGNIDLAKVGMYAGIAAAGALVVVLGLLLVALAGVALVAATFMLPAIIGLALVGAAIYGVIYVVGLIIDAFKAAYNYVANIDFAALGSSIVDGLVNGIKSGAGMLVDAVKNLGDTAKAGLMKALGIGSPSKVFAELGGFTAQGFAEGVEGGSSGVENAIGTMVTVPQGGAVTKNETSSSSKSTGPITIYVQGGSDAKEIADTIKRVLGDVMEGVAIEMGAPLEAGAT